jgi:hypothetical protein
VPVKQKPPFVFNFALIFLVPFFGLLEKRLFLSAIRGQNVLPQFTGFETLKKASTYWRRVIF